VARILKDRRALGEFQMCGKGRKPEGEPIPNYFPAVITEAEFYAARNGAEQRRQKPGRIGKHLNVFAGMLRHARDGDTFFRAAKDNGVFLNTGGSEGRAPYVSFPAKVLERAIFSKLQEIDPQEILNGDSGPDESLVLAGELSRVEAKITEIEDELLQGDVAALARVLRRLEDEKATLASRLSEARQRAANPLSETWGEAQSLLDALDSAPDPQDARLRLRAALRRIVDSIWLLVVPRGLDRLAWVQIWFAGKDRRRDYLILYRPAKANARSRTRGCVKVESRKPTAPLDLRNIEDARQLESWLAAEDLATLAAGMKDLADIEHGA
jgi:hypothetical protein